LITNASICVCTLLVALSEKFELHSKNVLHTYMCSDQIWDEGEVNPVIFHVGTE